MKIGGGVAPIAKKPEVRVNERIRVPMVRVISADGDQLGVMAISEALKMARVQEAATSWRCRRTRGRRSAEIMDFGKFKYEQSKHERQAKKKQHVYTIKEVKVRPKIEEHDFDLQDPERAEVPARAGQGEVHLRVPWTGNDAPWSWGTR